MGRRSAQDFSDQAKEQNLPLEHVVRYHLQNNHYPPVPSKMVPVAMEAIEKYKADRLDEYIKLPDGVTYRDSKLISVLDCMKSFHLYDVL